MATPFRTKVVRTAAAVTAIGALFTLTACAGENAATNTETGGADTLNLDYATYNPLSIVIKEQGFLEEDLDGVTVNWVKSAGSNKANEALRAEAIDIGSTAGSAALLNRANGAPIKTVMLYSQPEWAAMVTTEDSSVQSVEDLKGKSVAATKGTDPYFFLIQTLAEAGLELSDVTVQNLQHADGWSALQNGSVDAWAGLDPIMAGAEADGATLFHRNLDFNTYGALNANESFIEESPELVEAVIDAYARAAEWAAENPDETAQLLADEAGIDLATAEKVIKERSNLDVDPVPGDAYVNVLKTVGPIFVEAGDVTSQDQVDEAVDTLVDDSFVKKN